MELSPSMLKYTSFLLAILMRLSRVGNAPHFNPATAVFVGEALKLVTCFVILFNVSLTLAWGINCLTEFNLLRKTQRRKRIRESFRAITNSGELLRVSVPAMLYVVQNNLQYVAVSNLDAPTFEVMKRLKILTTAIFSVLMLKRTVLMSQWGSIVMLMIGVNLLLVQLDVFHLILPSNQSS
ncbi:hypothetical protein PsorP6_007742 [Peronosclerospora sorghi]|uniref:Uncharacterized protein n=1 Tax=Peronosclerospora sorghi TaxID=230839 RepID=A0ACC0W860_9STRA|nr:hypothetical protein PsorP6_007742 [Peronosclerospora sorghi]